MSARGGAALERVEAGWAALEASMLLRIQIVLIEALDLRARCALAAASASRDDRASRLAQVAHCARRIEGTGMAWALPLAGLHRAGIALLRGERPAAQASLANAVSGFDSAEMALHAAVARWRMGELAGGEPGGALVGAARGWMEEQGVRRPERLAAVLAPVGVAT